MKLDPSAASEGTKERKVESTRSTKNRVVNGGVFFLVTSLRDPTAPCGFVINHRYSHESRWTIRGISRTLGFNSFRCNFYME